MKYPWIGVATIFVFLFGVVYGLTMVAEHCNQRQVADRLSYLASCVLEKKQKSGKLPSRAEYIRECYNLAPFTESYQQMDPDHPHVAGQEPSFEFHKQTFPHEHLIRTYGEPPDHGFVIVRWNGESFDEYVSWTPEKVHLDVR